MLDPAIKDFLSERGKELDDWLPQVAKNAIKQSRLTHPVKFSHPDAKNISEIRAICKYRADGFLRTGNTDAEFDIVFNTAANIPIWKFLSLKLADGITVLEHLEQNTDSIKQQLKIPSMSFDEIREGLLGINKLSSTARTSEKIKQVYFPVSDDYHLLSILTPSGLIFKLKKTIEDSRKSAKQAKEAHRNNQYHEKGYDTFKNITLIGFGGAKSQNISFLNSQNGGVAYLLPSLPPTLQERVRIPKNNFFNALKYKSYEDSFKALHRLFTTKHKTIDIKDGIKNCLLFIIESVIEQQLSDKMWQLRQLENNWSDTTQLSQSQKIWLDNAYLEQRETEEDWLKTVIADFATWLIAAYKKIVGEQEAVTLDTEEQKFIKQLIAEYQEDLL